MKMYYLGHIPCTNYDLFLEDFHLHIYLYIHIFLLKYFYKKVYSTYKKTTEISDYQGKKIDVNIF